MLLENVVFGGTVESALYAFLKNYFFVPSTDFIPPFYKKSSINFLGNPREDYGWSRLNTLMSLEGRLLNYEHISKFKVSKDTVRVVTKNSSYQYYYKNCFIFDSTKVLFEDEIEILENKKHKYIVYDDFQVTNLGSKYKHLHPKISSDSLAKEIHFYSSDRIDGSDYITDCLVESFLFEENLQDFDYSETMCRFAIQRHLTSIGVFGSKAGIYKNGEIKYRKPKVAHNKRVVEKVDQTLYRDTDNIKFMRDYQIEDILF
tara:strand:- start:81 stop:857 length:777 start_codon:yes stop_codon:yes gene_type:complete